MITGSSVVTPERFQTGLGSFREWMAAIPERHAEFQRHYDEYVPQAEDLAALQALVEKHGLKALVLGEHWCPDVWRGLPVVAKIAERTGMEIRLFFRDKNMDLMNEFLKNGKSASIPVVVFYDRHHQYLCHWIERPKMAAELLAPFIAAMKAAPEGTPERQAAIARLTEVTWEHAASWRHATLQELRAMLEARLK
ncbi:MAG: thioredoxin family protein [Acidobacteriia bacterium]|nr:thioredoxin family protein [Terriglobia bacterium]